VLECLSVRTCYCEILNEDELLPGGLPREGWCLGREAVVAWRGVAWRGVAWRGVAWRGVAWRGVAWLGVGKRGDDIETTGKCLGLTMLSSLILAVLLIIGGIEQNPGPAVEMENTVRVLCIGCGAGEI